MEKQTLFHYIMTIFAYPEFFLIAPFIFYLLYLVCRSGNRRSEPTNWPLVGMLPIVVQNLHRIHDCITQILSECGGTFEFKGPCFSNLDMLITSDPENIDYILSKNFANYPKGPDFNKIFDIFGDGVFGSDFEMWRIHRRTTLSHLTHPEFAKSMEAAVWHKVETGLFPVLDYFCTLGTDFGLQDVLQRFTFDSICKLVLDCDPCSLSVELPHVPSEKAFNSLNESLFYRHIIPESIWKLQKWLKIGSEKKLMEAWEALDEFIYQNVDVNLQNRENREVENDLNLVETYKKVYEERKMGSSEGLRVFLRDTALSLMFAGKDTISTCLTWFFWLIATNPETEFKIRQEIETQLHNKWRFFTGEESRKLMYLHGALCESLRLFPPPALEHKAAAQSDVLPSGHQVRKGRKVIMSVYSEGRMESVWGKDCFEFKPDRWITPTGEFKHEPSYKFAAFHAGPRTCLGKEMAFVQMKMVAAAIMYRYNIQLVEGHPVCPRFSIILQAKHGLRVVLSKRN